MRAVMILCVALVALGLLAGCGKRGDLEAPEGKEDTSRRTYPTI